MSGQSWWERFWFQPSATSTLAVIRVGFATVTLLWTLSLMPDAAAFFEHDGIVGRAHEGWAGALLSRFDSPLLVHGTLWLMVVACISLAIGMWSKCSSVIVFLGLLLFQQRNPYVFNTGDLLLLTMGFYLMLSPVGVAMSVDSWRRKGEFWVSPLRPQWGLRLLQIQLSVVYISGVWSKLQGETWNSGTAVWFALRIEDLSRFPVPEILTHSLLVANLMTFGTLALELAVGIGVWLPRARKWVLIGGVALHFSISYSLRVGFFTAAMMLMYVAFTPPEQMAKAICRVREWPARSKLLFLRSLRRPIAGTTDSPTGRASACTNQGVQSRSPAGGR